MVHLQIYLPIHIHCSRLETNFLYESHFKREKNIGLCFVRAECNICLQQVAQNIAATALSHL